MVSNEHQQNQCQDDRIPESKGKDFRQLSRPSSTFKLWGCIIVCGNSTFGIHCFDRKVRTREKSRQLPVSFLPSFPFCCPPCGNMWKGGWWWWGWEMEGRKTLLLANAHKKGISLGCLESGNGEAQRRVLLHIAQQTIYYPKCLL